MVGWIFGICFGNLLGAERRLMVGTSLTCQSFLLFGIKIVTQKTSCATYLFQGESDEYKSYI